MSQDIQGIYQFSYGVRGSQLQCNYPTYLSSEESKYVPRDIQQLFRAVPIFLPEEVVGENASPLRNSRILDEEIALSEKYYKEVTQSDYVVSSMNRSSTQPQSPEGLSVEQTKQLDAIKSRSGLENNILLGYIKKLADASFVETTTQSTSQQFSRTSPYALGILPCDALLRVVNAEVGLSAVKQVSGHVVTGFGDISFIACSFNAPSSNKLAWMQPVIEGATSTTLVNTLVIAIRSIVDTVKVYQQKMEYLCHMLQQAAWLPSIYDYMRRFSEKLHTYLSKVIKCEQDSSIEIQMISKVQFTLYHDTLLTTTPLSCLLRCIFIHLRSNKPVSWEYVPARWSLYLPSLNFQVKSPQQNKFKQNPFLLECYTCVCDMYSEDNYQSRLIHLKQNESIASIGFSIDILLSLLPNCQLQPILDKSTVIGQDRKYTHLVTPANILKHKTSENSPLLSLLTSISETILSLEFQSAILHEKKSTVCYFNGTHSHACDKCHQVYKYLFLNNIVYLPTPTFAVPLKYASFAAEVGLDVLNNRCLTLEEQMQHTNQSVLDVETRLESIKSYVIQSTVNLCPIR